MRIFYLAQTCTRVVSFLFFRYLGVFRQHEQRSRKTHFSFKAKSQDSDPDIATKSKLMRGHSRQKAGNKLDVMNSKLLAGILTGVNRAFPYAQLPHSFFENEIDVLFRTVHTAPFGTAVQALLVLFHVTNTSSSQSAALSLPASKAAARFHRALYEKLLAPELGRSNKQSLFLNLIYRALKAKSMDDETSAAFVKRLLQVSGNLC